MYLALGTWLYTKRQKNDYIPSLMAITFWSSLWTISVLLFRIISVEYKVLYLLNASLYFFAALIASSFLRYALNLTGVKKSYSKTESILLNLPAITTIFFTTTKSLTPKIITHEQIKAITLGYGFYIYTAFIIGYFLAGLILLFNHWKISEGHFKKVLTYSLLSSLLTGIVDVTFNLLLIPFINYKLLWAGPMSGFFWCIILTYAITKHELVSVKVVITKSLSIVISGVLVVISILIPVYFLPLKPMFLVITTLFWAAFGNKIRLFIQTPLEKSFLVNNYSPSLVINKVNSQLMPVLKMDEALQILITILEDKLEISKINICDKKPENQLPCIHLTHGSNQIYLAFGPKLSEDDYTEKDLNLISAVENQLKIIQDRILQHEILERINIENEKQIKEQVEVILDNERKIQSLEKQRMRAERIADLSQMIQEYNHEIKTPQTALMQYIELLDHEDIHEMSSEQWDKTRERMKGFINRTIETVNTTLKLTPRETLPELDTIDINECIDEVLDNYRDLTHYKITVTKGKIRKMMGVENEIKLIINNLIKNAVDAFTEAQQKNGEIDISTRSSGDHLILTIRDNGPGIPKEFLDKIWNIYSTSRRTTGTGLGLPTVQARVMEHDGTIQVESEIGKGTTFTITFTVFVDYGEFENGEHIAN